MVVGVKTRRKGVALKLLWSYCRQPIDTTMYQALEGMQCGHLCSDSGNGVGKTILITWLTDENEDAQLFAPSVF
jgi:hypothetical protein